MRPRRISEIVTEDSVASQGLSLLPAKGHMEAGQQAEVKHMNEKGIKYKVFALGTGFAGTGFTGDALKRAASDGPIVL